MPFELGLCKKIYLIPVLPDAYTDEQTKHPDVGHLKFLLEEKIRLEKNHLEVLQSHKNHNNNA